ncbi:alpha/beta hydrolase [Paraliobacillus ryukyuensis]|uniref:alpha/beta hydrolase n=1 Tax=Paraliobacillus ryukyuensis TaxID=200904 RepID=UPI0015C4D5F0|nr:alpha/beta hydrolase [Paraliobacillus ryukyuensis]
MQSPITYTYKSTTNINMSMSLYRATNTRKNVTILYFHGGGLLYGERDDLPAIYIKQFTDAGYDLLTCDYPLAPEVTIDMIHQSIFELTMYYHKNRDTVFDLTNNEMILFGRSAGAYLALYLCRTLQKQAKLNPLAVISLYGYPGFQAPEFHQPNKHYLQFPKVEDSTIKGILSDTYVTEGAKEKRFSIYIKARQKGNWINYLQPKADIETYAVTSEDLSHFPPTILAASTHDPDVPYRLSKQMSRTIPKAKCLTIYGETHDFDRDTTDSTGMKTYEQILTWLEDKVIS